MRLHLLGCLLALSLAARAAESPADSQPASGVLKPVLQGISAEEVVVQWDTEQPAYGWVEYGETEDLGRKADSVVDGLRAANEKRHRVVLRGLTPGKTYWYRACAKPIRSFAAYRVDFEPEQYSAPASFQALPGSNQPVRAVIFNDLHNNAVTFHALRAAVGNQPFDFSVFNGDCLADPVSATQAFGVFRTFTEGVDSSSRPAFFIRGNHETRGAFARDLQSLLAWPNSKPYFAFNAGPVRFLVLDCGEDKPDDHKEYFGLVDFESFRREQTEWLKQELASHAFRKADWRVLLVHIPLYPSNLNGGYSKPSHDLWTPLLAKARIDVCLSAHLHRAAFHAQDAIGNPFPIFIGGGNQVNGATVMLLDASREELTVRVLNARGDEALPTFRKAR